MLLEAVKKGLGMPLSTSNFDDVLNQKILVVKSYMLGAGVCESLLEDDLAVGIIVLGVTDLWRLDGGEIKFSKAFHTLISQLACRS
jgi:hypothetical protein